MPEQPETPTTEEELRAGNSRIKWAMRISAFIYTPVLVLLLWNMQPPYWALLAAGFVAFEFGSYPFLVRMIDRGTENAIAELREKQGLTPASQLPDVGI